MQLQLENAELLLLNKKLLSELQERIQINANISDELMYIKASSLAQSESNIELQCKYNKLEISFAELKNRYEDIQHKYNILNNMYDNIVISYQQIKEQIVIKDVEYAKLQNEIAKSDSEDEYIKIEYI